MFYSKALKLIALIIVLSQGTLLLVASDTAISLKEEGNKLFKAKSYQKAHDKYIEAFHLETNTTYLSNAAFALFKMNRFNESKDLCEKVIQDESTLPRIKTKCQFRLLLCYRALDDMDESYSYALSLKRELDRDLETQANFSKPYKDLCRFIEENTRTIYLATHMHGEAETQRQLFSLIEKLSSLPQFFLLNEAQLQCRECSNCGSWNDPRIQAFASGISALKKLLSAKDPSALLTSDYIYFQLYNFFLMCQLQVRKEQLVEAHTKNPESAVLSALLKNFTAAEHKKAKKSLRQSSAMLADADDLSSWGLLGWTKSYLAQTAQSKNLKSLGHDILLCSELYVSHYKAKDFLIERLHALSAETLRELLSSDMNLKHPDNLSLIQSLYRRIVFDLRDDLMLSICQDKLSRGFKGVVVYMGLNHYPGAVARLKGIERCRLVRVQNEPQVFLLALMLQGINPYQGHESLPRVRFSDLETVFAQSSSSLLKR